MLVGGEVVLEVETTKVGIDGVDRDPRLFVDITLLLLSV